MSILDRLMELNVRNRELEEIQGTGEQRILLNEMLLDHERALRNKIGEAGFNKVIDAIVEYVEGNLSEEDVRKVYAQWS